MFRRPQAWPLRGRNLPEEPRVRALIDFHCHLDLFPNPALAADSAERAGMYMLPVTNTPKAFPKTAQLAKGRKRIRTALGLHPPACS
ncbi:TatD family hydrolase [Mesorhizobium sp. 128a]